MSEPSDPEIEALLRNVQLPAEYLGRLKASLSPSEEQLNAWLRHVPTPVDLLATLRGIPADEITEIALRDIPIPFHLTAGLRQATPLQRAIRGLHHAAYWSSAAALFIALWTGLFATEAWIVGSAYERSRHDLAHEIILPYHGPLTLNTTMDIPVQPAAILSELLSSGSETASTGDQMEAPLELSTSDESRPLGATQRWMQTSAGDFHPLHDVVLLRWGIFGAPHFADEQLPEIETPRLPISVGIEPPRVRGVDRRFLLKHRVHPPLSPAIPQLASIAVPLSVRTDAYRQMEQCVLRGRRPAPLQVQAEQFLAAMDYRFPPPAPGALDIRTTGGPSLFGPEGTGLLQVAVQAGDMRDRALPATHLILAVDFSASMNRGGRAAMVQQAVARVLDQLNTADRISLILFQDEVLHSLETLPVSEAAVIQQVLAETSPRGGSDLAGGLQQALGLALTSAPSNDLAQRIVLITDSRALMPDAIAAKMTQMCHAAAQARVQLQVLDVSTRQDRDPRLREWSTLLGGDVRNVEDERQIYWQLLEVLTGRSPVVAAEARLTIRFNPAAVAAYRLIGHDAGGLAGINPAVAPAQLRAREAATALFEIWFQPGAEDELAQAVVSWDNGSGQKMELTQRIGRRQFARSTAAMPLSLWQAALAAETAETLRGSREALRELNLTTGGVRGVSNVLAAAQHAPSPLWERPDFRRFVRLLEALDELPVR